MNTSIGKMHTLRFTSSLLLITLTANACSVLPRVTAKSEVNPTEPQLSAARFAQVKQHVVPTPSVKFPKNTFPEVQLSELTSPQVQVQENNQLTIITLPADLLFNFHTARLRPEAETVLRQVSQAIANRYPDTWLQILGHTDCLGNKKSSLDLSERQAAAVQQWLSTKGGIDVSLITKEGYGSTQPLAPNKKADHSDNLTGQQQNRRIEIVIQKYANPA